MPLALFGCGSVAPSAPAITSSTPASPAQPAAPAYAVDLQWDIPDSSADPIAGYNVYRTVANVAVYEMLNTTALDTQPSWSDSTVQSGVSYHYVVRSVDIYGVESAPSNTLDVSVP